MKEFAGPVRFLRCLLGFLLGLGATAFLLYRLVPREDVAFDEAFADAETCEVLFVGPSYIEVGLFPRFFDAESELLGHPLRACKFTRTALRGFELKHDLGLLMKHRWPALQRVVVDVTLSPQPAFQPANWFTPRMVHWHTWEGLVWLGRYYRARKKERWELAPLALAHLEHAAMNYSSVGRAGTLLSRARFVERLTGGDRGYTPPPDVPYLAREELFDERVLAGKQLAYDKAKSRARRAYESDDWPRELEPIIVGAGYAPAFLYAPVYRNRMPPRPSSQGKVLPLVFLDFIDPERYPELYEPIARGNTSHLNDEGAKRWSRILARELVKLADEPEGRGRRGKRQRGKRDPSDEP